MFEEVIYNFGKSDNRCILGFMSNLIKKSWTDSTAAATANNSDLTWSRLWTCSFGFRFFAAKLKRHRARIALRFSFNIRLMLCVFPKMTILYVTPMSVFKNYLIISVCLSKNILYSNKCSYSPFIKVVWSQKVFQFGSNIPKRCQIIILSTVHQKRRRSK